MQQCPCFKKNGSCDCLESGATVTRYKNDICLGKRILYFQSGYYNNSLGILEN